MSTAPSDARRVRRATGWLWRVGSHGGHALRLSVRADALLRRSPSIAWRQRAFARGGATSTLRSARQAFYARTWSDAARHNDATIALLGDGRFRVERDGASVVVHHSTTGLDDDDKIARALDKPSLLASLRGHDVPTPVSCEFDTDDLEPAFSFLAQDPAPCIMKPALGTGAGAGVCGPIRTADDLLRACLAGRHWGSTFLIERIVEGTELRVMFLDGELLDAVSRRRPHVTGDGHTTIARLMEREFRRRLAAPAHDELRPLRTDLEAELTLSAQGLALDTVVPAGTEIAVKTAVSQNARRENRTEKELGTALVEDARRAVAATGLRLAGVDLVAPDMGVSLRESGGVVIEVNHDPGFHYHYLVDEPERATPVAIPILARLLENARRSP